MKRARSEVWKDLDLRKLVAGLPEEEQATPVNKVIADMQHDDGLVFLVKGSGRPFFDFHLELQVERNMICAFLWSDTVERFKLKLNGQVMGVHRDGQFLEVLQFFVPQAKWRMAYRSVKTCEDLARVNAMLND